MPVPVVLGINWRDPLPFYYLSLAVAAVSYFAVVYVARSTFGLSLQAIRDNPRRMNALGFNVYLHRVAAHAFAGFIAALGGVLLVWMNQRISPATIDIGRAHQHPRDRRARRAAPSHRPVHRRRRFRSLAELRHRSDRHARALQPVIGAVFLVIVLFSPDGLLGLWQRFVGWARSAGGAGGWRQDRSS